MSKANDGGQAFPTISFLEKNDAHAPERRSKYWTVGEGGMSLRAYFAGQALPGVIAICAGDKPRIGESLEGMFARKTIACADTLIAELEKDATS